MSFLKQLVTGYANRDYVLMPKVYGGCYGCREARMLAAMREGLLSDVYWLGHAPVLGPSYLAGRHQLEVYCTQCDSRILAHVVILPDGPALWVESVTLIFGCKPGETSPDFQEDPVPPRAMTRDEYAAWLLAGKP